MQHLPVAMSARIESASPGELCRRDNPSSFDLDLARALRRRIERQVQHRSRQTLRAPRPTALSSEAASRALNRPK